jgi:TRAP-type C4-dicarboxylate transport system permease small subunit
MAEANPAVEPDALPAARDPRRVANSVVNRLANGTGLALFAALFIVFLIQIGARFLFKLPLSWTDELAVVLYLWVILWAAAFMVPERDHVAFDLLTNLLPPRWQAGIQALGSVIVGTLAAWAFPATWDYVQFMQREGTPVLGLPFMAVFFPFIFLFATLVWRGLRGVGLLVRLWRGL